MNPYNRYLIGGFLSIGLAMSNGLIMFIGFLSGIIYSYIYFFVAYDFIASILYVIIFFFLYDMLKKRYDYQTINPFLIFHMILWGIIALVTLSRLFLPEDPIFYMNMTLRILRNANKVIFCLVLLIHLKQCTNIFIKPFAVIWLFAGLYHLFHTSLNLFGVNFLFFGLGGQFFAPLRVDFLV